jgi:hypothetical protein
VVISGSGGSRFWMIDYVIPASLSISSYRIDKTRDRYFQVRTLMKKIKSNDEFDFHGKNIGSPFTADSTHFGEGM